MCSGGTCSLVGEGNDDDHFIGLTVFKLQKVKRSQTKAAAASGEPVQGKATTSSTLGVGIHLLSARQLGL